MITPLLIGIALAGGLAVLMTRVAIDRDRAYYPVVLIVVASYYVLFAVIGGSLRALMLETIAMAAFTAVALVGFRSNLQWVAAAIVAHGLFDVVHGYLIANAGVPMWWPAFCMAFDIAAGGYAAWLFASRRTAGRAY
jgi:hypothetical protein